MCRSTGSSRWPFAIKAVDRFPHLRFGLDDHLSAFLMGSDTDVETLVRSAIQVEATRPRALKACYEHHSFEMLDNEGVI